MENCILLKVHQAACLGANFFYPIPAKSTHFKFQNRIRQKKTDIQISDCPTLTYTFSEAANIYHDLPTKHRNNI